MRTGSVAAWACALAIVLGGFQGGAVPAGDDGTAGAALEKALQQLERVGAPAEALAKVRAAQARIAALEAAGLDFGMEPATRGPPRVPSAADLVDQLFGDGCGTPPLADPLDLVRVPRAPIAIQGNADFTPANGVLAGSGTASDPYVIALWDLRGSPNLQGYTLPLLDPGLLIANTDAHVRVQHVAAGTSKLVSGIADVVRSQLGGPAGDLAEIALEQVLGAVGAFHAGIVVRDARNVVLQGVDAVGNDIGVVFQGHVEAELRCSRITDNLWSGVGDDFEPVTGGRVVLERNHIARNDWGGVDFWEDTPADFVFRDNVFEANAWSGLDTWGDVPSGAYILEGNAFLANDWGGMDLWGDYLGPSAVRIADNRAEANGWSGINVWGDFRAGGSLEVAGNEASDNAWGGIELWSDYAGTSVVVRGNTADDNAWSGIDVWGDYTGSSMAAEDNAASGNRWGGLVAWGDLDGASSMVLAGNDLRANGFVSNYGGLETWGRTPAGSTAVIRDNVLDGNKYGLRIGRGAPLVQANEVHNNQVGVVLWRTTSGPPQPTLAGNDLAGNTDFGVRNDNAVMVNAEGNWWGDASGPGGQGPGSGDKVTAYVDYAPWLQAAP